MIPPCTPTKVSDAFIGSRVQKCRIKKGFDTATIARWLGLTIGSYEAREAGQRRFDVTELMELGYKFEVPPSTFANDQTALRGAAAPAQQPAKPLS